MKQVHYTIATISFVVLIATSGCARYAAQPLKRIETATPKDTSDTFVSLSYKPFDKYDCKQFLDRDVIKQGYQPVQITIRNNTDRYLNLSKANMSLPSVSAEYVAKKVHTDTLARAAGYGVAGLVIAPFLIPAVVDGVKSSQANQKLDDDFNKKELRDQMVGPHNTVTGLIFVPANEYKTDFSLKLFDIAEKNEYVLSTHNPIIKI